jgi:hypothetical protein
VASLAVARSGTGNVSDFDRLMAKIQSQAQADRREAKGIKDVAPLVANLKPGKNYFTPAQFSDVVRFLVDDGQTHGPLKRGKHTLGDIEIMRVRWLREDRLVGITELAKLAKVPYRTMAHQLANSNLPCKRERGKKLYDIDMLRDHLGAFAIAK